MPSLKKTSSQVSENFAISKAAQLCFESPGKILEVLYATEDGFAVPADEEEEGMPPPPYDF